MSANCPVTLSAHGRINAPNLAVPGDTTSVPSDGSAASSMLLLILQCHRLT